jgi:hypothetical protein
MLKSHLRIFSHISRHLKWLPGFLNGCPKLESTYIHGPKCPSADLLSTPSQAHETCVYIQSHKRFSTFRFLDPFAKLRKATINDVMSVRMKQLGSRWTDIHKILSALFRKSVEKIQISLQSDTNNG